ncbi:MAG: pyridoxine 5'-phosphate synthase [Phycisphaeraceae bacterium]
MTHLSVNVNKVALLRNARPGDIPNVTHAARLALEAGCAGITIHPRPDQRHIRSHDVDDIAQLLDEPAYRDREYNIEGNPFLGHYMEHVRRVRPDQCTLVPDSPAQSTSDHGWNVKVEGEKLKPIVAELKTLGCRVSLFMDPDPDQIERVPDLGADRIELYTESYAVAYAKGGQELEQTYSRFAEAANCATNCGLGVNAGHDLNLHNLGRFVTIPNILEVSIGHALIADALELGMAGAVKAYLSVLAGAR